MKLSPEQLSTKAISLLKTLIETPSYSSEEHNTADLIKAWFKGFNIPCERANNNIYAFNKHFDSAKPTLLLNSHHDTVKPNSAYSRNPFSADIEDGKLYGLGSNDAGGCLVSLLATFTYFYDQKDLNHNLIIVASAEEESSGVNGLNSMLEILPSIDLALVGEPTLMDLAIAEKGLVVFDATVNGTASHAAHPNEDNPIYKTIEVLQWFQNYSFEKVSDTLGKTKLTVTQLSAGNQHNVVPAQVDFVLDVRVNDCYSNSEIAEILQAEAPCKLVPRSLRLNSSAIDKDHPIVRSGVKLGRSTYGSPTLSDQAALSCQSLKMGPGDSRRSHSADEFIYINEIEEGIDIYIKMLEGFLLQK